MDPVTIAGLVAACAGLVSNTRSFINGINNLRTRYKDVNVNSNALLAQTGAVQAAASGIRQWLDRDGSNLGEDERNSLQHSLEACTTIISIMYNGVRDVLRERSRGSTQWRFWERVRFLCDQDQMDQYAVRLSHQVAALSLHLQTLNLPNPTARRERLRSPEGRTLIRNALNAASSLSESLHSESATVSSVSQRTANSQNHQQPTPTALTAENLAMIDEELEEGSDVSKRGGPSNPFHRSRRSRVGRRANGEPSGARRSVNDSQKMSDVASEIQSNLDEIRTVITNSTTGRHSKSEIKTSLDRLTDLMRRMLRSRTHQTSSEISDMEKEATDLFAKLEKMLRDLERETEAPIFSAVQKGDLAKVIQLLDDGVSIESVNKKGETVLHVAVREMKQDIVRELLNREAPLEALDHKGRTPLLAIHFKGIETKPAIPLIKCLVTAGTNLEAAVAGEGTILHKAISQGDIAAVGLLLVHGASIHARMLPNLETPLHSALRSPHTTTGAMVKRFMELGANAHVETADGQTPLALVCKNLVNAEAVLKRINPLDGIIMSSLFWPCYWFKVHIDIALTFLEHLDSANETSEHFVALKRTYAFRNARHWEGISKDYLMYELQAQRTFAMLESDEVIHQAIRNFHQTRSLLGVDKTSTISILTDNEA